MPIPVAKLHEAQKPFEDRILAFLARDPDQAYSLWEIRVGVEDWSQEVAALVALLLSREQGRAAQEPYRVALEGLLRAGRVHAADVRGTQYFALV